MSARARGGGDAAACRGSTCVDQAHSGGAARRGDAMSQFAAGLYASDNFRINCYKVLPCPQRSSHAWSACPFAHPNERLRRRPLHRVGAPGPLYGAELCPAVRARQECPMGSECGFAHNAFEHWLHPSMYRTRLCASGEACNRAVCFFAHSNDELRVVPPSSPPPALPPLLVPSSESSPRAAASRPLPLVAVAGATGAAPAAAAAGGGASATSLTTGPTAWERTLAALGLVPTEPLPLLAGECGAAAAAVSALALDGAALPAALLQAAPLSLAGQHPVAWDDAGPLNRQLSLLAASPSPAVHEAPAQSLLLAGNPLSMAVMAAGGGAGAAPASAYGFAASPPVAPQPAAQGAPLLLAAAPPQLQPQPLLLVPVGSLTQGERSMHANLILMH
ncbi:hypothetical protein Rsub_10973 [Raphidocelis subcapitata]|uniref:C3H1-type domain-containing protein n=1 Tax=Raphidocelis subcapitata TaxID=307507 RepID=A0A2V0PK75_9CHLO|nr:hypothetical protein Rsub_10973 [Raphidocelis subcapitata]|eukprot:GBF98310.1 hypothetical protein Rsub_10973 [Raphidocelis subcapitata]